MTDRVPKLLVDALDAISAAQEFLADTALDQYLVDKMRRSAVEQDIAEMSVEVLNVRIATNAERVFAEPQYLHRAVVKHF